ncbi:MAG: Plug domain-containing protein, partial [Acidobacteria bacterium]|nr:Plug domain-containing protein [Acidobacteriota bacterium]
MIFSLAPAMAQSPEPPAQAEPEKDAAKTEEEAEKKAEEEKKKDATAEKLDALTYTSDITVTATRVETDKMKTPVAVTTFDQDALDRKGIQTVKDLANLVPNMD